MPPSNIRRRLLHATAFLPATLLLPAASSQASTADAEYPRLEGSDAQGHAVRLSALRGRVVLIFHWRTDCAVCRDKMHELRANLVGWQGQSFTLIGVNSDTRRQDWLDYENLVVRTVPPAQRFSSIWRGDASTNDSMAPPTQWPSASLIDKNGRLVARYRGRIPAQAWDNIAALL